MALVAVTHGAMSRLRLLAPATALALAIPMALFTTAAQAAVPSGGGTAAVTIDGATRYQQISGFGASEAFGQAQTIMDAPSATQKQVPDHLAERDQRGRGQYHRAEGAERPQRHADLPAVVVDRRRPGAAVVRPKDQG